MPASRDMCLPPYTHLRFAEHFGHVNRVIYAGESWEACAKDMRRSWDALEPGLAWDEASAHVRTAWDDAGKDTSLADLPL